MLLRSLNGRSARGKSPMPDKTATEVVMALEAARERMKDA